MEDPVFRVHHGTDSPKHPATQRVWIGIELPFSSIFLILPHILSQRNETPLARRFAMPTKVMSEQEFRKLFQKDGATRQELAEAIWLLVAEPDQVLSRESTDDFVLEEELLVECLADQNMLVSKVMVAQAVEALFERLLTEHPTDWWCKGRFGSDGCCLLRLAQHVCTRQLPVFDRLLATVNASQSDEAGDAYISLMFFITHINWGGAAWFQKQIRESPHWRTAFEFYLWRSGWQAFNVAAAFPDDRFDEQLFLAIARRAMSAQLCPVSSGDVALTGMILLANNRIQTARALAKLSGEYNLSGKGQPRGASSL